jgi:oligoribonuclease
VEAPLVWVDLEMTGLDPARDVILEVAVIVTDGELEHLEEGPDLVVSQPEAALAGMPDHVAQMHAKSGLTEEVRRSELSLADAEEAVLGFVRGCVAEERTAPLAGNSVHADRAFLEVGMPSLNEYLHYRLVDVSTVKELARRWHPQALDSAPQKAEGHRALADIRESIAELRHYRTALFRQA